MSDPAPPRRPSLPTRSAADLAQHMRMPFEPRAMALMALPMTGSDVIIATFPKAGTTWTQQICHGLRSNGDMNFKEVSWVAPWIEQGHMFGIDANIPQQFAPRVFKTHLPYAQVNKGARYIHVVREPKDTLVSFYSFMSGGVVDPTAISLTTFAEAWLLADQLGERTDPDAPFGANLYNYWRHLLDWWDARAHAPVLTLTYEQMRADLPRHVARIADFMGIDADAQVLDVATRQASFEFMHTHKDQFSDEIPGIPRRFEKVVRGEVGAHRSLVSEELSARIDAAWRRYITPVLGFTSYEDFTAALAAAG